MPTKTGEIKSDISIKWYGRKSICVVLGRINLDIIRNKCGNFKTSVARGKKTKFAFKHHNILQVSNTLSPPSLDDPPLCIFWRAKRVI